MAIEVGTRLNKEFRLLQLQTILQYCSSRHNAVFSIGERICINQERGRLMNQDFDYSQPFEYSSKLKSKIDFLLGKTEMVLNKETID